MRAQCSFVFTLKMAAIRIWILVALSGLVTQSLGNEYQVGVGIADITGPAAEVGMMGYAKEGQNTKGIHMRLFSRAFIFDDGWKRHVYISADCGMIDQLLKIEIISRLNKEFGDLYRFENVLLTATHTHSGPAGFLQYVLFSVSSLGFVEQTFQAMVTGIVESIRRAHANVKPAEIYYAEGELHNSNINRSPTSYLVNPESERAMYEYDTDHIVSQLNIFDGHSGEPMGIINWFAVHPTSMNNSNKLISGDNKGYASQLFEKHINGKGVRPGKGSFVAAFASSNLGDVSPNLKGPKCIDTGLDCDLYHSTCDGKTANCIAFGPGRTMVESTKIIAERQFEKAMELFDNSTFRVTGPIRFAHQWIDMTNRVVRKPNGRSVTTCKAALGYSFAAGTTDGPGMFDFTQGSNSSNAFWDLVSGLLKDPSPEQIACHAPKPILLDTGEISFPYPWHPSIVDTQIIQIGQIAIAGMPGECTTMAGRRMRNTVKEAGLGHFEKVIVAGLSNVYTHYITTYEEYQRQRYEAASTIFGPHTLLAYQQQYKYLTEMMIQDLEIPQGTPPPNLHDKQISLVPGVLFDGHPIGTNYGDCILQPPPVSYPGDTVVAKFISGHPRNDLLLEKTFLCVERLSEENSTWELVATDADWDTQFVWHRTDFVLGHSEVEIHWWIPNDVTPGSYRIRHFGHSKGILNRQVQYYEGTSSKFFVSLDIPKNHRRRVYRKKKPRKNASVKNLQKLIKEIWSM